MIWLIGAGQMAVEYANVLIAQDRPFICITRSTHSAFEFERIVNHSAISGGVEAFLKTCPPCPSHAIVATDAENLTPTSVQLLDYGVKQVLLEKPGGLSLEEVQLTLDAMLLNRAQVFVAYNRRFYASVLRAQEFIAKDGGVSSLNYEITEWAHVIEKLDKSQRVKQNWFLANTTHVIDLAFFLGGNPKDYKSYSAGKTAWHPSSASFAGAGITDSNALFSYHGNWNAPGRWSLEVLTIKHRLIFRPMEQLQIQHLGSVVIQPVELDLDFEKEFKPGLYKQTETFLRGESARLCSLAEHQNNMAIYCKMAGYPESQG